MNNTPKAVVLTPCRKCDHYEGVIDGQRFSIPVMWVIGFQRANPGATAFDAIRSWIHDEEMEKIHLANLKNRSTPIYPGSSSNQ